MKLYCRALVPCLFLAGIVLCLLLASRSQRFPSSPSPGNGQASAPTNPLPGSLAKLAPARIVPAGRVPAAVVGLAHPQSAAADWRGSTASLPAFARFADWVDRYTAAGTAEAKAALESEGIALAQARLAAMADLIQSDPKRTLELAVPHRARKDLPASVTSLLEQRVNAMGDYEVLGFAPLPPTGGPGSGTAIRRGIAPVLRYAVVAGERHQVFTFDKGLGYVTRANVPLNGIRVPLAAAAATRRGSAPVANRLQPAAFLMALDPQPSRMLDASEVAEMLEDVGGQANCPTSGNAWTKNSEPAAEEIGGKVFTFCGQVHAGDWAVAAMVAAGLETPAAPASLPTAASSYTEGRKRMLLMRPIWSDYTGGMTTNDALTHFQNLSNYMWQMSYGKLVLAAPGNGSEITPSMVLPGLVAEYDDTGLGKLYNTCRGVAETNHGYNLGQFDFTYVCTGGQPAAGYAGLAYVGGVGFHLANGYWDAGVSSHEFGHNLGLNHAHFWETGGRSIIGTGQNVEYGDNNDPMGGGANPNQFNSRYKNYLGWIPNADVADLNVLGSGRYRLYCFDLDYGTGLRGLKFTRNTSQNYWVNFRQRKTTKPALMNGVQLLWTGNGNQGSYLLDARLKNNADDNAVVIGRTFSDTAAGFHVTPVGKGNTYPESMDVVVNVGQFATNQPPVATVSANNANASPGQSITFTATASDPNGDALAYYWEFGDGEYSVENRAVTSHSFPAAAEYAVQCVVSDMKGGTSRRTVVVTIGDPGTFRISGRVLDRSNRALSGIRVSTDTGRSVFTDSDGSYTLPGLAAGSHTLEAVEPVGDGMTFVHPFFNNPVVVGPNYIGADFIGVIGNVSVYQPLIAKGASWRYLDTGVDQGSAWRTPSFDDAAWPVAVAPLGYPSDAPIATVIGYGPDANNKFITSYFRRQFTVNDPAAFTNLLLEVLRDDGVVVYLNGVEVFRDNMPAGAMAYSTLASSTVEPDNYLAATLTTALLVSGTNTLVAEVHQGAPTSSDIAFDAAISGLSASNAAAFNLVYVSSPPDRAEFVSPADVAIAVTALAGSGAVSSVAFFADGVNLGSDTVAPFQWNWIDPSSGSHVLRAVATIGSLQITSTPVTIVVSAPVSTPPTTPLPLIATNAVWRYLANGSAPPAGWAEPGYNDSVWPQGAAQLGYGEGDELTTLPFGGNPSAKWITTYFRRAFLVDEPALITNLMVRLLRDDGGIVYLNGVEVFRSNIPDGVVNHLTLANNAGDDGKTIFGNALDPSLLMPGTNLLAVEIHQDSGTSSDVSFALGLQAELMTLPRGVYLTAPANGASLTAPSAVELYALASAGSGATIASVEFFSDAGSIGIDAFSPYSAALNVNAAGALNLWAVATDSAGQTLTSAPVAITLNAPPVGTALVSLGALWSYLDDGLPPAANWMTRAFDDRLWNSGPARLGYGGDGERTRVSFGPNPGSKHITTYFRKSFVVPDPGAFDGLLLRLVRDDGAVVYLNGAEIHRDNLPPGLVSWNSLAATTVDGAGEQSPRDVVLGAGRLVAGTNVVAVEIHQAAIASSDLGFDLALTGLAGTNLVQGVYLTSPAEGARFNLSSGIPLSAYAVADPPVTLVEYFDGGAKIGEASAPPYAVTWTGATVGVHSVSARATYGAGAIFVSEPVTLVVGDPPAPVAPVFETLIPARSGWKYWDNAASAGNGWQGTNFNDDAWPGGAARFGYGLDGEATTLTAGRVTHYFRRWFNAANPALLNQLVFQLQRDDGAVVYLNGTEVFRNNMPDGSVTAATLATATLNTPDETAWVETVLPIAGSGLGAGGNLVAVELHQASAASSDAGFDLQLAGYGTTEDRVVLSSPATGAAYRLGDPIALEAFVWAGGGRAVGNVEFFLEGQRINVSATAPFQFTLTATNYGTYYFTAAANLSDGSRVDSEPVVVSVVRQGVATTLIASNSVWRFLDNGSNQGTNWAQPNYSEIGWKTGAARLGYGNDGEITPVLFGGNAANKFITTYFRRAVVVPAGFAYTNLAFRLVRDDGAVVWLNGRELFRANMPGTAINSTTLASAPVSGAEEQTFYLTTLDVAPLPAGTNVVAVEIHQNAANSSDLGFNLELVGNGYLDDDPQPRLEIRMDEGLVELSWPVSAVGWRVFGAAEIPSSPEAWLPVSGASVAVNGRYVLTVPAVAGSQFFRLGRP